MKGACKFGYMLPAVVLAVMLTPAMAHAQASPWVQLNGNSPATGTPGTTTVDLKKQQEAEDQAMFESLLRDLNPLTPAQQKAVIKRGEEIERARTRPAPQFSNVLRNVPLDPADETPTIEMDLGLPTAISFVDSTGQPWPIEYCSSSAGFASDEDKGGEGKAPKVSGAGHAFVIRTVSQVENGGAVCFLKDLTTPIPLKLVAGNHKHYQTFTGRVPRMGPNRKPPLYTPVAPEFKAGDDLLSNFLMGLPPQGADQLEIEGGGSLVQAWRYKGDMYIRSSMQLLNPQCGDATTLGEIHICRVKPMPILSFDNDGQNVDVLVKGAKVVRASVPPEVALGQGVDNAAPMKAISHGNAISGGRE